METIPTLELFIIRWICALPLEVTVTGEILDKNFRIL
jgi:hypothetical protein